MRMRQACRLGATRLACSASWLSALQPMLASSVLDVYWPSDMLGTVCHSVAPECLHQLGGPALSAAVCSAPTERCLQGNTHVQPKTQAVTCTAI